MSALIKWTKYEWGLFFPEQKFSWRNNVGKNTSTSNFRQSSERVRLLFLKNMQQPVEADARMGKMNVYRGIFGLQARDSLFHNPHTFHLVPMRSHLKAWVKVSVTTI